MYFLQIFIGCHNNCSLLKHLKDKSGNNNQTFKQFDYSKQIFILLIQIIPPGLLKCDNIN